MFTKEAISVMLISTDVVRNNIVFLLEFLVRRLMRQMIFRTVILLELIIQMISFRTILSLAIE